MSQGCHGVRKILLLSKPVRLRLVGVEGGFGLGSCWVDRFGGIGFMKLGRVQCFILISRKEAGCSPAYTTCTGDTGFRSRFLVYLNKASLFHRCSIIQVCKVSNFFAVARL
jgi:hypothetical protein